MLIPSKKIFYAVEAVLYIAYNAKTDPVSGGEVATAQNLPTRYLEPMMQKLVRAGILRGVRGPQGGYVLGRERRRIALADISAALAESSAFPECETALGQQILYPAAQTLMQAWQQEMAKLTIADLCERAAEKNIASAHETAHDFTI